jgi:hypothetical protein
MEDIAAMSGGLSSEGLGVVNMYARAGIDVLDAPVPHPGIPSVTFGDMFASGRQFVIPSDTVDFDDRTLVDRILESMRQRDPTDQTLIDRAFSFDPGAGESFWDTAVRRTARYRYRQMSPDDQRSWLPMGIEDEGDYVEMLMTTMDTGADELLPDDMRRELLIAILEYENMNNPEVLHLLRRQRRPGRLPEVPGIEHTGTTGFEMRGSPERLMIGDWTIEPTDLSHDGRFQLIGPRSGPDESSTRLGRGGADQYGDDYVIYSIGEGQSPIFDDVEDVIRRSIDEGNTWEEVGYEYFVNETGLSGWPFRFDEDMVRLGETEAETMARLGISDVDVDQAILDSRPDTPVIPDPFAELSDLPDPPARLDPTISEFGDYPADWDHLLSPEDRAERFQASGIPDPFVDPAAPALPAPNDYAGWTRMWDALDLNDQQAIAAAWSTAHPNTPTSMNRSMMLRWYETERIPSAPIPPGQQPGRHELDEPF